MDLVAPGRNHTDHNRWKDKTFHKIDHLHSCLIKVKILHIKGEGLVYRIHKKLEKVSFGPSNLFSILNKTAIFWSNTNQSKYTGSASWESPSKYSLEHIPV